jgi:hypothetical protein
MQHGQLGIRLAYYRITHVSSPSQCTTTDYAERDPSPESRSGITIESYHRSHFLSGLPRSGFASEVRTFVPARVTRLTPYV